MEMRKVMWRIDSVLVRENNQQQRFEPSHLLFKKWIIWGLSAERFGLTDGRLEAGREVGDAEREGGVGMTGCRRGCDTYCRWQRLQGQTGRSVVMKGKRTALFSSRWPNQALSPLPDIDSKALSVFSPLCLCLFLSAILSLHQSQTLLLIFLLQATCLFSFCRSSFTFFPLLLSSRLFKSIPLAHTYLLLASCMRMYLCERVSLRLRPSHGRLHKLQRPNEV